jgi:biopolymer transport protein ExbD
MSASENGASPMALGLYFIDVLACLLFCLTLALVNANFRRETTVPLELPRLPAGAAPGPDLPGVSIALREGEDGPELFYDGEPVTVEDLAERLAAAPPPSLVLRAETSVLTEVIGLAHAAGVHDIQLAYARTKNGGER